VYRRAADRCSVARTFKDSPSLTDVSGVQQLAVTTCRASMMNDSALDLARPPARSPAGRPPGRSVGACYSLRPTSAHVDDDVARLIDDGSVIGDAPSPRTTQSSLARCVNIAARARPVYAPFPRRRALLPRRKKYPYIRDD